MKKTEQMTETLGVYLRAGELDLIRERAKLLGVSMAEMARMAIIPGYKRPSRPPRITSMPEYSVWRSMIARCYNEDDESFENYGARGIAVSAKWTGPDGFKRFLNDVGRRPSELHSIDRIDNDGDYTPGNVRWATRDQQCRNRRSNVMITVNGETLCMLDWANRLGVWSSTIAARLRLGWTEEDAVTKPVQPRNKRALCQKTNEPTEQKFC